MALLAASGGPASGGGLSKEIIVWVGIELWNV